MGEFNWSKETYTPGGDGGGDFVDPEHFKKLIYTDAVCYITAIREGVSSNSFDGKPPAAQWLVDFIDPAGDELTKGFTKGNAERDSRIQRLSNTLAAAPDEPLAVSFLSVPNARGNARQDIGAPRGPVE